MKEKTQVLSLDWLGIHIKTLLIVGVVISTGNLANAQQQGGSQNSGELTSLPCEEYHPCEAECVAYNSAWVSAKNAKADFVAARDAHDKARGRFQRATQGDPPIVLEGEVRDQMQTTLDGLGQARQDALNEWIAKHSAVEAANKALMECLEN